MKRIIDLGSNMDPATPMQTFLATQSLYDTMQSAPIDGSVWNLENNSGSIITQGLYSSTEYSLDDVSNLYSATLRRANTTGWGRSRYNWIYVGFANNTLDWFGSSISTFINNFIMAGQFVAETNMYGIWLDLEPYSSNIWKYSSMPLKSRYTFQQYSDQVYSVGALIGNGWNHHAKYQGTVPRVMTSKSYAFIYTHDDEMIAGTPQTSTYGLSISFLNGLYDSLGDRYNRAEIVLTDNNAWGAFSESSDIPTAISELKGTSGDSRYKGSSDWFDSLTTFGHGSWLDLGGESSYPPFDNVDINSNQLSPDNYRDQTNVFLESVDWIWVLQNNYKLFNSSSIINSEYTAALRSVRVTNEMV